MLSVAGAVLLLAGLATNAVLQPTYSDRYNAFEVLSTDPVPDSSPVPDFVVARAWREATRLLVAKGAPPVPPSFLPPERVLRVRYDYLLEVDGGPGSLFGIYQVTHYLTPAGRMQIDEQVVIFSPRDCIVHEVLVHEFIHALHERLCHASSGEGYVCTVEPESFVRYFYPDRQDFPACPAVEEDPFCRPTS